MKCPKCGYLAFEAAERCRNCGYEFALSQPAAPSPELPLRADEPLGPLGDFSLNGVKDLTPRRRPAPASPEGLDLDRIPGAPAAPDLPLFGSAGADELPLVTAPAVPRAPLAVRRSTPVPARIRPRIPRPDPVEQQLGLDAQPAERLQPDAPPDAPAGTAGAAPTSRLLAGLIDLLLIGSLDLVVLYFTLRLCRLTAADIRLLPPAPLLAFFAVLNGGYLVAFTSAGGQTIGKMATGIRVVGADGERVPFGQAAVRVAATLVSILPAGIGLLPALVGSAGRALHDRVAGTRVVRL